MIRRKDHNGFEEYVEYDSVEDLLSMQGPSEDNRTHEDAFLFTKYSGDPNYGFRGGVNDLPSYRKLVTQGWSEGVVKLKESLGDLKQSYAVKSVRRTPVWKEDGDEIEISRVYEGDLDHAWRGAVRRIGNGGQTHVKIWVAGAANSGKNPEQFFWRGACASVLADTLEDAGYRTNIIIYTQSRDVFEAKGGSHFASIPLKRYDEPLDLERIAAVASHVAFFRTAIFAARLSCSARVEGGMGSTIYGPPSCAEPDDLVVCDIFNLQQTTEFLQKVLANFES